MSTASAKGEDQAAVETWSEALHHELRGLTPRQLARLPPDQTRLPAPSRRAGHAMGLERPKLFCRCLTPTLALTALLLLLLAQGCATTDQPLPDPHLLNFLREGQTKREDIALKFGPPSRTLEQERVLFYRLGQNRKGYFVREARYENWADVRHSLVLVLDEHGVLQKHSLVSVR